MGKNLVIWVLCDGKPGHENQSIGLAEAMGRRVGCLIHRVALQQSFVLQRLGMLPETTGLPKPDYIFGAGHATHLPLMRLAGRTGAKSIVLMKPTLPLACFHRCIAPVHDFPDGYKHPRVILTLGALHRVTPGTGARRGGLVLIGGPPSGSAWDGTGMNSLLDTLVHEGEWVVGDSRRTPEGWLAGLEGRWPGVKLVSHAATGPDWVRESMAMAEQVWVTEDSISMVCEAAGSGARVGILPLPGTIPRARIRKGIDAMVAAGHATRHGHWLQTCCLPEPVAPLLEADRCAEILLKEEGG